MLALQPVRATRHPPPPPFPRQQQKRRRPEATLAAGGGGGWWWENSLGFALSVHLRDRRRQHLPLDVHAGGVERLRPLRPAAAAAQRPVREEVEQRPEQEVHKDLRPRPAGRGEPAGQPCIRSAAASTMAIAQSQAAAGDGTGGRRQAAAAAAAAAAADRHGDRDQDEPEVDQPDEHHPGRHQHQRRHHHPQQLAVRPALLRPSRRRRPTLRPRRRSIVPAGAPGDCGRLRSENTGRWPRS